MPILLCRSLRARLLPKTCLCTNSSETGRCCGWREEERGKDDCEGGRVKPDGNLAWERWRGQVTTFPYHCSLIPLWFVDFSVSRDFHQLFFLVVILSNSSHTTYILSCIQGCCIWLGSMYLTQAWGTIHTTAGVELRRSHTVPHWGPGCFFYDAQRMTVSLLASGKIFHVLSISHLISSSQTLSARPPFSSIFSIFLSLHWFFC